MLRPTRVAVYVLVALALLITTATVLDRLDPCTDLDSDCDVQGIGMAVWSVLVVVVVMPFVVGMTELVARHRGWDVRRQRPRT